MDRFVNASEYERQQAKEHARVIAFGVATAFFALVGLLIIVRSGYYSWLVFGTSTLAAMVAWGMSYATVYIVALPTEPADWHETPEREIPDNPPPPPNQVKHQFTAVFGGRLRIGSQLEPIPEDVGEGNITHIAAMRARGELDNISFRALDGIGISRNAKNPPNAQTVAAWLIRVGALDSNGNWTQKGRVCFPSPNDGTNTDSVSGVAFYSGDATAATAATGQSHYTGRPS